MDSEQVLNYAKKHGKKLTEEEAIEIVVQQINRAIENLQPAFDAPIIGFDHRLADPRFREVIRRYNREARPLLEKYGTSNRYAVLRLNPEASVEDIMAVHSQLKAELGGLSYLLLANDKVIARHQKDLEARGFDFIPDWRDEGSVYRRLLKAGETNGKIYEMVRRDSGWTYKAYINERFLKFKCIQ